MRKSERHEPAEAPRLIEYSCVFAAGACFIVGYYHFSHSADCFASVSAPEFDTHTASLRARVCT